jgi:hypothetical protein
MEMHVGLQLTDLVKVMSKAVDEKSFVFLRRSVDQLRYCCYAIQRLFIPQYQHPHAPPEVNRASKLTMKNAGKSTGTRSLTPLPLPNKGKKCLSGIITLLL